MKNRTQTILELTPIDNRRLASLCGQLDEHLRQIEKKLEVDIHNRGHHFEISGTSEAVAKACHILTQLYAETDQAETLLPDKIHLFLCGNHKPMPTTQASHENIPEILVQTLRGPVKAHTANQQRYLQNILTHDMSFGVGPAGTGKTYLAVACAVFALEREQVSRILLVRPAVEAGERLGFLPGDFSQKLDPYFRPLYDALYEMLGFEQVMRLVEQHVIEVVPLAYMRGRTLNDAFIILDESQNTTKEQMKMFLTRIGFNSKAVITGDITQTDLPRGSLSGLSHALNVLKKVKGISFTHFDASDVVRHPLVQSILQAYDEHEAKTNKTNKSL